MCTLYFGSARNLQKKKHFSTKRNRFCLGFFFWGGGFFVLFCKWDMPIVLYVSFQNAMFCIHKKARQASADYRLLHCAFARWFWPDLMNERKCSYHFTLRLFTMVRSSCGTIDCWTLALTSSLVRWSMYRMGSFGVFFVLFCFFRQHLISMA